MSADLISADVVLPYNRVFIILFAGVVFVVWLSFPSTRLVLYCAAVTQHRAMAVACASHSAVDWLTFGLGSGIAGVGGVALANR